MKKWLINRKGDPSFGMVMLMFGLACIIIGETGRQTGYMGIKDGVKGKLYVEDPGVGFDSIRWYQSEKYNTIQNFRIRVPQCQLDQTRTDEIGDGGIAKEEKINLAPSPSKPGTLLSLR